MISIIKDNDGTFSVIEGDWLADKLAWDEMLGLVASLTISEPVVRRRYMRDCNVWVRHQQMLDKQTNEQNQ